MALLPKGIEPAISSNQLPEASNGFEGLEDIKYALRTGRIPPEKAYELLEALPQETLRTLVHKIAGPDASFLVTLKRQVALVDAVINNLVYPDGRMKASASEAGISLKDALTMSRSVTQTIIKDMPNVYKIERLQKLERAFGDVMEKHFTPEQRDEVLKSLSEAAPSEDF